MSQSSSDPDIGVKQFQVLDTNLLANRAKQLAVLAIEPDLSSGHVQITNPALSPTVGIISLVPTSVANRFKAFMRQYLNTGLGCIAINALIDNFYSTKGKVRCYG